MKLVLRALGALALAAVAAHAEEFRFDASQFERKRFELTGYAELKADRSWLDRDSAFYKVNFPGGEAGAALTRSVVTFKPSGALRLGEAASARFRAHLDVQRDELSEMRNHRFDEASLSYKPSPGFTLDAGKVAMKWGKGYAWNPAAFVERPKDPTDPELAREGFTVISADLIRNFDGPLQTLAFTPVLLPASNSVNSEFGAPGHLNAAAKLYLLYRDTDIDLLFLGQGSRSRRWGVDFSRNLGSSLEIHGEWAWVKDASHPVTDARGAAVRQAAEAASFLVGTRYLTGRETTYIVEYYRNGSGYTREESGDFYRFVDTAASRFAGAADATLLHRAANLAQSGYGRPSAGRSYLYFRASQKDPFDWLYWTPALTLIANLEDRSASVVPEVLYTGIRNVELRARAFFLAGGARTEFGEKQASRRVELLLRAYF